MVGFAVGNAASQLWQSDQPATDPGEPIDPIDPPQGFGPSPSTGFTLQQNADLRTTNWVTAPQAMTDNGTNKFIIVNPPVGNRFYRLFKP